SSRSPQTAAGDTRVTLSRDEKALREEGTEQCRLAADEIEDRLVARGRWRLPRLCDGTARAALEGGEDASRRACAALRRRAGGADRQGRNEIEAELDQTIALLRELNRDLKGG